MKQITTYTQKKLVLFPLVNISILFIVLINCFCNRVSIKTWMKVFPYLFGYTIPMGLLWMILAQSLPNLSWLFSFCSMYFTPLTMGCGLIKYQEKHLNI